MSLDSRTSAGEGHSALVKTILLPLDFSDSSGGLVEVAAAEAAERQARLVLLHVVEPAAEVAGFESDPEMMRVRFGEILEDESRIETVRLKELAADLGKRGLDVDFLVRVGLPADEILDQAKLLQADLVVMGSHGHGALYHLFTGSVVTGVLKSIGCPVLVVPLRRSAA